MTTSEQELLDALSAARAHPEDGGIATRLLAAKRALPMSHVLSNDARDQVRALAAMRDRLHRDFLFFLLGALRGDADPVAIAFLIGLVPDAGVGHNATDALNALDPLVVAGPYRAASLGPSLGGSADQLLRAGLEAKLALAEGRPAEITTELLELWAANCDLVGMRLAIAAGADVNAKISQGESLLHLATASWIGVTWDDPAIGPTRAMWEPMITMLSAAGADGDRKLEMRFGLGDQTWAKGTTPRKMIAGERKTMNVPAADLDRLDALFPGSKKGKKS